LVDGRRVIQCNIRDMTARRHAEAALLRANDELVALVTALRVREREIRLLNRLHDLLQACTIPEATSRHRHPVGRHCGGA
jgi:hypothetical protein